MEKAMWGGLLEKLELIDNTEKENEELLVKSIELMLPILEADYILYRVAGGVIHKIRSNTTLSKRLEKQLESFAFEACRANCGGHHIEGYYTLILGPVPVSPTNNGIGVLLCRSNVNGGDQLSRTVSVMLRNMLKRRHAELVSTKGNRAPDYRVKKIPKAKAQPRLIRDLSSKIATERALKKQKELQANENHILNLILKGERLYHILNTVAVAAEHFDPSIKASIMLYSEDSGTLTSAASPNLPGEYSALLDNLPVGPSMGTCGTAAYYKRRVVTPDVSSDSRWVHLGEIYNTALKYGLNSCWSAPIIDSQGNVLGTVANYSSTKRWPGEDSLNIMDWSARVTALVIERKEAESRLLQQEAQLRGILESQRDLILRFGPGKIITFANAAYYRMFGENREGIIGRPLDFEAHLHPEDAPAARDAVDKVLSGEKFSQVETRAYSAVCGEFILSWEGYPIYDKDGSVVEGQVVGRDITEQKEMENRLRESEKKYQSILQTQKEMICRFTCDTTLTFVNDAYCRMINRSRNELIGKRFIELIPEEYKNFVRQQVNKVGPNRLYNTYRHPVYQPDGSTVWQEWTDYAVLDEQGDIVEYQAVGRDITKEKQAEEQLKMLADEYEKVFNGTQDALFLVEVVNVQAGFFRFIRNNHAHEEETGITAQMMRGRTPQDLFGEAAGSRMVYNYSRCIEKEQTISFEESYELPVGKKIWLTSLTPVFYSGQAQYIVGSSKDITRQKEMETEIKRSERRYRLLIENANEAIVITQKGSLKFVNPKAVELFGYPEYKLLGKTLDELTHPEDKELMLKLLNENDPGTRYSFRVLSGDGSMKWVETNTALIEWEGQTASLSIINDITERINSEQALKKSYEEIRRLSDKVLRAYEEERGRIARELHDESSQVLSILKAILKQKSQEYNLDLTDAINMTSDMLANIKKLVYSLRPFPLELGLKQAVENLVTHLQDSSLKTHIDFRIAGGGDLLPESIKICIYRCVQETLTNAIRHASARNVELKFSSENGYIVTEINDDGTGFDMNRVSQGSSGIRGMQERARLLGGEVKIETALGRGTSVNIIIPVEGEHKR